MVWHKVRKERSGYKEAKKPSKKARAAAEKVNMDQACNRAHCNVCNITFKKHGGKKDIEMHGHA